MSTFLLLPLSSAIAAAEILDAPPAAESESASGEKTYFFDSTLFRGRGISEELLDRLQRGMPAVGRHTVDIHLNGQFLGRGEVQVVEGGDSGFHTCVAKAVFQKVALQGLHSLVDQGDCVRLEAMVPGGRTRFDLARMRVELEVPDVALKRPPRGHVDRADLDRGINAAYVNYSANSYRLSQRGQTSDSGYLSLDVGVNLLGWQFRQQGSFNHSAGAGRWTTLRGHAQRSLPELQSQVVVGQSYTSGRFLSGLAYEGVSLSSDERMLADSQRGYAPVVRGVANSAAQVSIRQKGQEIYQTTVAPGAFEIRDLYPTHLNGDLDVSVLESDGTVRSFSVPFASVPESLRPGRSRHDVVVGRVRDMVDDRAFVDASYQRGLSNRLTVLGALRMSEGYRAFVLGGAHASGIGAWGLDLTHSTAAVGGGQDISGWMAHLSYSRTFTDTNTTVSLAGYRYSTHGYRDLQQLVDGATDRDEADVLSAGRQRQRFEATMSQSLGRYGTVFLSGSTHSYRDGGGQGQFQLGYGMAFGNGASVNLALARQGLLVPQQLSVWERGGWGMAKQRENSLSLTFSVPLGKPGASGKRALSTRYGQSNQGGGQYQATLSGLTGRNELNYAMSASHASGRSDTVLNASASMRTPHVTLGGNVSHGSGFWQGGLNLQGSVLAHAGGLTFGPYLGETFALIQATGARGAQVVGGQGIRIDRRGYALLPALSAYRLNTVWLDPLGLHGGVELLDSEQRIAPHAGAISRVVFRTRSGTALMIDSRSSEGVGVPMGAEVFDGGDSVIGVAGQGGVIYARVEAMHGDLRVRWGSQAAQSCVVSYRIDGIDALTGVQRLVAPCRWRQDRE